jgi:hypothetical protein
MIQIPSGSVASYLAATNANAILITQQPQPLLATSVAGLHRLPRDVAIAWLVWCGADHAEQLMRQRNELAALRHAQSQRARRWGYPNQ